MAGAAPTVGVQQHVGAPRVRLAAPHDECGVGRPRADGDYEAGPSEEGGCEFI